MEQLKEEEIIIVETPPKTAPEVLLEMPVPQTVPIPEPPKPVTPEVKPVEEVKTVPEMTPDEKLKQLMSEIKKDEQRYSVAENTDFNDFIVDGNKPKTDMKTLPRADIETPQEIERMIREAKNEYDAIPNKTKEKDKAKVIKNKIKQLEDAKQTQLEYERTLAPDSAEERERIQNLAMNINKKVVRPYKTLSDDQFKQERAMVIEMANVYFKQWAEMMAEMLINMSIGAEHFTAKLKGYSANLLKRKEQLKICCMQIMIEQNMKGKSFITEMGGAGMLAMVLGGTALTTLVENGAYVPVKPPEVKKN